ncbi:MAG: endo-1,4-beta-xylanase [Rhodocyclaceae bacterium]|nr:endo-1,4-beta-xylanase [Rhodocyclaceae bacterium]
MIKRLLLFLIGIVAGSVTAYAEVDRAFIGTHFHDAGKKPLAVSASIGSLRLWDARLGWNYLEPAKGAWAFEAMDVAVADARQANLEILYPLGLTPKWASSDPERASAYGPGNSMPPRLMADWEEYVRTVVRRYRGRIAAYEIWNEPNRALFFGGTTADLKRLTCSAYAIIKQIDPAAKVVGAAATDQMQGVRWLADFLDKEVLSCVDAIGFHLYTLAHEPPEAVVPIVREIRNVLVSKGAASVPLWNTEFGWYIANSQVANDSRYKVLNASTARDFLLRSFVVQASLGIERAFQYAWNNRRMGVIEPDTGKVKDVGEAFAVAARWLGGADEVSCRESAGIYRCSVRRGITRNLIVWSVSGTRKVDRTELGGFNRVSFAGEQEVPLIGNEIEFSGTPALLRP